MAKQQRDGERERQWRGVMRRCADSGLSVREFCRRERLPESAFYFWRRTLLERDADAADRTLVMPESGPAPAFVPVTLPQDPRASAIEITIELGPGLTIRFDESAAPQRVAALVRALRLQEAVA
jgi:transposase